MKKEFLANAIGNIGDGYVEEFARVKRHNRLAAVFASIGAVGAAAALALFIGLNANRAVEPDYTKLPKIAFEDYRNGGAMGGNIWRTGHVSDDLPPIFNENMKIKTMPVYMSESTEPNREKMLAYVRSAAAALGISESELVIEDNYDRCKKTEENNLAAYDPDAPDDGKYDSFEPIHKMIWQGYQVTATAGDIELRLYSNYDLLITYGSSPEDGIELPAEYSFAEDAPAEEREKALGYLAERFKALTGYENSRLHADRAGYMINRAADGSAASEIVNGTLDTTLFQIAEEGGRYMLCGIIVHSPAGLTKLGDYPIISAEEAEQILKSDQFAEEQRMPENAEILQVELIYENWRGYTAVMPYYDFYVRSDDRYSDPDSSVTVCDLYRVSAIPSSYLAGSETEDYGTRAY